MSLACDACGHEWNGDMIDPARLPMPMNAAIAATKAVVCAKCGAGYKHLKLKFGKAHRADLPEMKFNPESKTWHTTL